MAFIGYATAMMMPLTPYTFGTMSLGRNPADVAQDLVVLRRAMEAGVSSHSSPTYNQGFTFMVLRLAFDENRSRVPKMVIKVRDASVPLMRFEVEDSCRRLGLDTIDVAQLVSMDPRPGNLLDQLRGRGGLLADELALLRERGLIRHAVVFLTQENSNAAVEATKSELIEGVTLYWNAHQCDCSNTAWAAIREKGISTLALRTLGGGPSDKTSIAKSEDLAELVKASGCRDATEFNIRLAASEPVIQTTIGGTASLAHLEDYLNASTTPLPAKILQRVEHLRIH
jgi:aryl-alcohol dehydrogenase-like predicted oxidoreductase